MLLTSLQALKITQHAWVSIIDWLNTRIIQYRQPSCSNMSQVLNFIHVYLTANRCSLSVLAWSLWQFQDKSYIWAVHWFKYVTLWHNYIQNILLVTQTWALFPLYSFLHSIFCPFFPLFVLYTGHFVHKSVAKLYKR